MLARGTRPDAKTVVGWLEQLPALAARAGEGPALLIIGDVVARSDAWREAHRGSSQGDRGMTSPLQQKLKITGRW